MARRSGECRGEFDVLVGMVRLLTRLLETYFFDLACLTTLASQMALLRVSLNRAFGWSHVLCVNYELKPARPSRVFVIGLSVPLSHETLKSSLDVQICTDEWCICSVKVLQKYALERVL
jgi:hypothetical protein